MPGTSQAAAKSAKLEMTQRISIFMSDLLHLYFLYDFGVLKLHCEDIFFEDIFPEDIFPEDIFR
jgi:hypothetical protein